MGQWDVVTEIESLSVSEHEAALPHPPWLLASGAYVLTLSSAALLLAPSVPHPKRNMPGHATHHAKRRCSLLVQPARAALGVGGTASRSGACEEDSAEPGLPKGARPAALPDTGCGLG